MTVTITQNVSDVTGADDLTAWRFSSVLRESDGTIITSATQAVRPVDGILTVELEPGYATVAFNGATYAFEVPGEDSDLWTLIASGIAFPPDTTEAAVGAAVDAWLTAHPFGSVTVVNISDSSALGRALLQAVDDVEARDIIGVGDAVPPYDTYYLQTLTTRAVGYGQNVMGIKLQRAVTFTSVTFRCGTADASGDLVVELRKNGAQVAGTPTTIPFGSQVTGVTATGSWLFDAGDILTVYITGVGTTPGVGLVADIAGMVNQ